MNFNLFGYHFGRASSNNRNPIFVAAGSSNSAKATRLNTVVAALARYTQDSFAEPELKLVDKTTGEYIYGSPIIELLSYPDPDNKVSYTSFMRQLVLSYKLFGCVYIEIVEDLAGDPYSLFIHHPNSIKAEYSRNGLLEGYEVGDSKELLNPENIIYITENSFDKNLIGSNCLEAASRLILADSAIDSYTLEIIENPAVAGLVITGINASTQEEVNAVRDEVYANFGKGNRGSTIVLNDDVKVSQVGFKPSDLDIQTMSERLEERICAAWGLPPIVVGLQQRDSKFSNFEEARKLATETFLVPLWRFVAEEITLQLGPKFSLPQNQKLQFDISLLKPLQEDEGARHQRVREDYLAGVITRAEARRLLNFPSTEADDVFVDIATAPGDEVL